MRKLFGFVLALCLALGASQASARYLQADPLGLVDGPSVYGYAKQNPGRYVDPRGEQTTGRNANTASPIQQLQTTQQTALITGINTQLSRLQLPPFSSVMPRNGMGTARGNQTLRNLLRNLQQTPTPNGQLLGCGIGGTTVYVSPNGVYVPGGPNIYVGITNNFINRSNQHSGRFPITVVPGATNLSRPLARGVEQALIMRGGGVSGGNLLNQRNSIGLNNPNFGPLTSQGNAFLNQIGQ